MTLDATRKLGKTLGGQSTELDTVKQNISPDESESQDQIVIFDDIKLSQELKIYGKRLPEAFVLDHPVLGDLEAYTVGVPENDFSELFMFANTLDNSLGTKTLSGTATYDTDNEDTYASYSGGSVDIGTSLETAGIALRFYYSGENTYYLTIGDESHGPSGIELRGVFDTALLLYYWSGSSGTMINLGMSIDIGWHDVLINLDGSSNTISAYLDDEPLKTGASQLAPLTDTEVFLGAQNIKHLIISPTLFSSTNRDEIISTVYESDKIPELIFNQGYISNLVTIPITMPVKIGTEVTLLYDSEA